MVKLTNLSDMELVEKCRQEYCSDCILEIRRRHEGLIIKIISRYLKSLNERGYTLNEILLDIDYIIWNAIKQFNYKKSAFPTFLANSMRFYCLNTLNAINNYREKILDFPNEELYNIHDDYIRNKENKEFNNYTFTILNQLSDKRVAKIFKLRYFSGKKKMSFKEIGKRLKISGWWVSLLHSSGKRILKEKLSEVKVNDEI